MANFEGTVPTKQGLVLIGKVGTGVPLNFTRVAVGSGVWSPEQVAKPAAMTGLIKEEMTLAISPESIKAKEEPEGDEPVGCYSMRVMLTNSGLASGFALREIGIYATDPDLGEILYAVDYAGDLYDYIPSLPANAAPLEKIFNLDFLTGTAKEIFVNQSPVLLATVDDIGDHNTDPEAHPDLLDRLATGIPEILTPAEGAEVGETPFFTFRPFVANIANTVEEAIQLQVDLIAGNFAAPIHDTGWLTTIAAGYELPAALLVAGQNIYKSRVRRRLTNGLISPWSTVVMMTTKQTFNYTDRAKNVSPSPGATNVMECPTFVGNAFSVTGDVADTHEATRGFILKNGEILYATGDLGPVTQFTPPPGYHQVSGEYEWQIQYKGATLGWGEKSAPTRYYTAPAFITGDEAISFTGWDGYDSASAAGVALADGAALRSNGVDQGDGEGDWTSYTVREKIRDAGINISDRATAEEMVTSYPIKENDEMVAPEGRGTIGPVTNSSVDNWNQLTAINLADSLGFGDYGFVLCCNPKAGTDIYAIKSRYEPTIKRSTDDAQTWSVAYTFPEKVRGMYITDDGIILVLTADDNYNCNVYSSTDGANTFNKLNLETFYSTNTYSLIANADASVIYIAAGEWFSNDGGKHFSKPPVAVHYTFTPNHAILPCGRFLAIGGVSSTHSLIYTDDNGYNWGKYEYGTTGLPDCSEFHRLAVHPATGKVFFNGYSTGGVFVSDDKGKTWQSFHNESLIYGMAVIGDWVYCGMYFNHATPGIKRINIYTKEVEVVALNASSGEGVSTPQGINYNGRKVLFGPVRTTSTHYPKVYTGELVISLYTASITPNLSAPPTRAHILPKLTAATGTAGTAFTAADFNEIPVANATLGTDTDTDRPDFILLESEKITPATPFRRVAIGASGLSKDSLINITETQCDTWKQGA